MLRGVSTNGQGAHRHDRSPSRIDGGDRLAQAHPPRQRCIRPDVSKGHQHEGAFEYAWMRNTETAASDRDVVVQNQIDVDLPWTPVKRFRTSHVALNAL